MKDSERSEAVLVHRGHDPAGKMEIPATIDLNHFDVLEEDPSRGSPFHGA